MGDRLVVVDSGGANTGSVRHALARLGLDAPLTTDAARIAAAERVLLPGVGTAAQIMGRLAGHGLVDVVRGLTQPVLGICVGMQVLLDSSAEGDVAGLGLVPGRVEALAPGPGVRVPHMGWNTLALTPAGERDPLAAGLGPGASVYFVHSYAAPVSGPGAPAPGEVLATTTHGRDLVALVRRGSVWGAQFHPERSGAVGAELLRRFCLTPAEELLA